MLDLVIRNASIVDGTGAAPFDGTVGVRDGRIVVVARGRATVPEEGARIVDGAGRALAPGSVDVHSHSDLSPFVLPDMPSTIRQGVTTVVVGNCGSSPWPLAAWSEAVQLAYGDPAAFPAPSWASWGEYLDAIDAAGPAVNLATLVGHGSLRTQAVGSARRPATVDEIAWMRRTASEAVREGAVGLSTGLIYVPGMYAETDEIVAVAEGAAEAGGIYASHVRGEGRDLFAAVDEAIEIGRRAGLPVHVSHLKCESSRVWGRAGDLLARLAAADDATADQYPYPAWNSSLSSLLPPWAPVRDLPAIDGDADRRRRLRAAVEEGEPDFQSSVDGVGWDAIVVVETRDTRWRGRDLVSIAGEMRVEPFDALLLLLLEDPDTSCIGHAMDPADVRAILADPGVFVASDSSATAPDGPGGDLPVHPRDYGTFPRALAMARDQDLLPIEAIVRKMTSLPADRFGLHGRGRIEEGSVADLVVFDPVTVRDTATFDDPHRFPDGIDLVVVNGRVAWEAGTPGIARHGGAIRRRG